MPRSLAPRRRLAAVLLGASVVGNFAQAQAAEGAPHPGPRVSQPASATTSVDATSPATASAAATTPTTTTTDATSPAAAAPADPPAVAPSTPPTSSSEPSGDPVPAAATKKLSYAARLVTPVVVRATPAADGRRITTLDPFGSWNGGPVVLQIAEVREVDGERWLRVRLPIRPNGATGWLAASSVEIKRLRYRVTVSRRLHRLTLFRDGRKMASARVVVGAPGTPTPTGSFAVLEVVRQPKGEEIGPWALHLTAHSDVLDDYGGGPGRVALHGRRGALLRDPLGTSRSHGCVRMDNAFIEKLRRYATEGTPVVIT